MTSLADDPWFLPPVTRQSPSTGKPGLRLGAQIELMAPLEGTGAPSPGHYPRRRCPSGWRWPPARHWPWAPCSAAPLACAGTEITLGLLDRNTSSGSIAASAAHWQCG